MRRGTIVSGKVLSDGRLDGMVRVGVSTILGPPSRDSQKVPDYGECLVRQDGTFRVPTRFPPGKYRVVVGRSTEPTPEPRITPMASLDIQLDGSKAEFAVDLPIPAK